ncbi:HNH endonuclease [Paenibacillus sp. RRE4]|uniref:HNH endonuclease n=1 Tax=Paenibacillus sp. RRE4 TaxID=2962587 RepID=UPI0037C59F0B
METGSAAFREGKTEHETRQTKTCMYCGERRPASEFRRRTGRRASSGARRGACRRCRQLGVREQRMAETAQSVKSEQRRNAMDNTLREDMASSPVKNEREQERSKRIGSMQSATGDEPGRDLVNRVDSDELASPVSSESGTVRIGQTEKDGTIASVSATPSQRKKRRRRRKKKPSEMINAHASAQAESESKASTDLHAVDGRLPGGERPPGDVHSPGVAAANGKANAAAKAQPAAAGREPSHASRSHGAGMDGRPRRHHAPPAAIDPEDPASLRTNRQGMVRMRGKTDKGRRWHQEVDMELAVTLVKEKAAVVINRYTIRRLFSNKDFKRFILERDKYTCYFCGSYGDTIDHLLPRAKGGHTTPLNCVCACNLCNQSKAAMDADEFMRSGIPEWNAAHQAELLALEIQETGLE